MPERTGQNPEAGLAPQYMCLGGRFACGNVGGWCCEEEVVVSVILCGLGVVYLLYMPTQDGLGVLDAAGEVRISWMGDETGVGCCEIDGMEE